MFNFSNDQTTVKAEMRHIKIIIYIMCMMFVYCISVWKCKEISDYRATHIYILNIHQHRIQNKPTNTKKIQNVVQKNNLILNPNKPFLCFKL